MPEQRLSQLCPYILSVDSAEGQTGRWRSPFTRRSHMYFPGEFPPLSVTILFSLSVFYFPHIEALLSSAPLSRASSSSKLLFLSLWNVDYRHTSSVSLTSTFWPLVLSSIIYGMSASQCNPDFQETNQSFDSLLTLNLLSGYQTADFKWIIDQNHSRILLQFFLYSTCCFCKNRNCYQTFASVNRR